MTILQIELELRTRLDVVRRRLAALTTCNGEAAALRDEQLFLAQLIEAIEAVSE